MARSNSGSEQSNPEPQSFQVGDDQVAPVVDEETNAGLTPADEEEFRPYVEWVGGVGYREVTKEQWQEAGVEDQGTVVWTRESPRVLLSELSENARQRLAGEPNFKFVTEEPREDD